MMAIFTKFTSKPFTLIRLFSTETPKTVKINCNSYIADEWTNVTPKIISLTERKLYLQQQHPLGLLAHGVKEHFSSFKSINFPSPVVTIHQNFDSILIPPDHVSRGKSDTYYVNKDHLLRSHTSAHQQECLLSGARKFLCIADVYRRDVIDSTHFPAFHQCEIMELLYKSDLDITEEAVLKSPGQRMETHQEYHDPKVTNKLIQLMKHSIEGYIKTLLGHSIEMRWVPAYFPFTHPSLELEILINGKWLEILGAGIVEHKLLTNNGVVDSIGWALGFGLERLAMLKYKIPDIRIFWSKDSGVTHQFKTLRPWDNYEFKPISVFPQLINDISFWLPSDGKYCENDFYDLVRTLGDDLVEQIELIDDYTNKQGRRSNCFRIVYRSNERTLTQNEVSLINQKIAQESIKLLGVEIR